MITCPRHVSRIPGSKLSSNTSPGALQDEPGGFHIQDSDPIDPDEDVDVDVE